MSAPVEEELVVAAEHAGRSWRGTLRVFGTLLTGEGLARVVGLATTILLARRLGPHGFGVAAFGLAVVSWLSLVGDAGTELLSTRDVARAPERFRHVADRILGLRLVFALAAGSGLAAVALLFARSSTTGHTYALFALVLPALALNLRMMTLGVGGARWVALGTGVAQATLLLGTLAVIHDDGDIARVPLLYAASEAAFATTVALGLAPRFGLVRPRIDLPAWRKALKGSMPLAVGSAARGALHSWDLAMLGVLVGPGAAGNYSAGSRPVRFLIGTSSLFYLSFLSTYSPLRRGAADALLRRSVRAVLLLTVPLAAALAALSGVVVSVVFGDEYTAAAAALAILAWKVPISAVGAPFSAALLSHDRQLVLMRNAVTAALVGLVLVPALVVAAGVPGAAVGSLVSLAVVVGLNVRACLTAKIVPGLRELAGGGGDG